MTAKSFAFVAGLVYLAVGVLGFIPALVTPAPDHAPGLSVTAFHGYLLGIFPVNFMHNLVHLAVGAWGVAASRALGGARAYSKSLAVIFGILAVMGLIPALNTVFGMVPLHGNDVWLHGGTAAIAAYFGWVSRGAGASATRAAH